VKLLNQHYGSAQAGLDENRRLAQEKNNVAYQTAQKYLPIQTKMNGLSGLGVGQSASVDLYNKYATRQGAIDASHASESNDLFKNYMTDRNAAETQQRAEQDALFNQAQEIIAGGYYTDWSDLENYLINDVWGKVRPEQQSYLQQMYDYEMSNPTTIQLKEEERIAREGLTSKPSEESTNPAVKTANQNVKYAEESSDGYSKGGRADLPFEVNIDGTVFKGMSLNKNPETTENLLSAAEAIPDEKIFSYDNKLYMKRGGQVFQVNASNDDEYQQILAMINNSKEPNPNSLLQYFRPSQNMKKVGSNFAKYFGDGISKGLAKYLYPVE
jgi:hypothetical protein